MQLLGGYGSNLEVIDDHGITRFIRHKDHKGHVAYITVFSGEVCVKFRVLASFKTFYEFGMA
jgi:hypothetical protein